MVIIRLDDPAPHDPHSRTMIPVKCHHVTGGWAQFRNGGYEFDVDDNLSERINDGSIALDFEMEDGRPVAVRFVAADRKPA